MVISVAKSVLTFMAIAITMTQIALIGKGGFCMEVIGVSLKLIPKPAPTYLSKLVR
jgi:hypothetical protein